MMIENSTVECQSIDRCVDSLVDDSSITVRSINSESFTHRRIFHSCIVRRTVFSTLFLYVRSLTMQSSIDVLSCSINGPEVTRASAQARVEVSLVARCTLRVGWLRAIRQQLALVEEYFELS